MWKLDEGDNDGDVDELGLNQEDGGVTLEDEAGTGLSALIALMASSISLEVSL